MHTLVGWSARALGVYGLCRGPTSHTVIAQLSPKHVVRPLIEGHHARVLVAPMKAPHLRIFSNIFKKILFLREIFVTMVCAEDSVRDEQTHPHRPRLVVSHSTCPPLSSSPPVNSFMIGPAVINTHRDRDGRVHWQVRTPGRARA